jgi:argininosuccinate lyase
MHLSRLSEEIVIWNSWEFKFIELDDAYATGSSIMPQKKNPDICELIRGKTGRVYGDLMQLLTTMKGLPLAYNKDMQEDKESFFDAADTVEICLRVIVPMLQTMEVRKDNMEKRALVGYMNATDLADYLVTKGMPFRDAYKISGQVVALCSKKGCAINDLDLEQLQQFSELFEKDVYDVIDLHACLERRNTYGAPGEQSQKDQIDEIDHYIARFRSKGWVAE